MKRPLLYTLLDPKFLLVMQFVLATLLFYPSDLEPVLSEDSASYINQSHIDVFDTENLRQFRTMGYPLLIKIVRSFDPQGMTLPAIHLMIFYFAVGLLMHALILIGVRPVSALICVSSILWNSFLTSGFFAHILTDFLALAVALIAVGFLVMLIKQTSRKKLWLAYTLAVTAAYQIRPAYIFLLAFLPLCAFALFRLTEPNTGIKRHLLLSGLVFTASIVPYVGFCLMRFVLVGHFGLVSFAGANLIGISGQILGPELLTELSGPNQSFAERIIEERSSPAGRLGLQQWTDPFSAEDGYKIIENQHTYIIWAISFPVAKAMFGNEITKIDKSFVDLSTNIIFREPTKYAKWLLWSVRELVRRSAAKQSWLAAALILLLLPIGLMRAHANRQAIHKIFDSQQRFELSLMLLLGLGFWACKGGLVVLVEVLYDRYVTAAALMLPGILWLSAGLLAESLSPSLLSKRFAEKHFFRKV